MRAVRRRVVGLAMTSVAAVCLAADKAATRPAQSQPVQSQPTPSRAASRPATAPATRPAAAVARGPLGIRLMDVSRQDNAAQLIRAFGGHLVVNEVRPGSRAQRIGLVPSDAIKRIDGKPVHTVEDVLAAVGRGGLLKIEVIRHGKPHTFQETEEEPASDGL